MVSCDPVEDLRSTASCDVDGYPLEADAHSIRSEESGASQAHRSLFLRMGCGGSAPVEEEEDLGEEDRPGSNFVDLDESSHDDFSDQGAGVWHWLCNPSLVEDEQGGCFDCADKGDGAREEDVTPSSSEPPQTIAVESPWRRLACGCCARAPVVAAPAAAQSGRPREEGDTETMRTVCCVEPGEGSAASTSAPSTPRGQGGDLAEWPPSYSPISSGPVSASAVGSQSEFQAALEVVPHSQTAESGVAAAMANPLGAIEWLDSGTDSRACALTHRRASASVRTVIVSDAVEWL